MKSQATAFAKWKKGVSTGGDAYKAGIDNPRQKWSTATANSASRWEAGVQQAVSDGRFAKRVTAPASEQRWHDHAKGKGSTRWQSSVNDAAVQANYQAGLSVLYGYLDTANNAIASMPRTTQAERDQRLLTYIHSVHSSAQQRKASGQ